MADETPTTPEKQPDGPPVEALAAANDAGPAAADAAAALQADMADMKDKLLRTLAEMENLRRRTEREVADAKLYGVTAFARDMLTFADNLHRAIDWKNLDREYEMPRLVSAAGSPDNTWEIAVRPGEKARLELELCGAMASPTLTVNNRTLRFPVTLTAGGRLLCRDGRNWRALDAQRNRIAEGRLDARAPLLNSGPNRIAFTCAAPDRAFVKLAKVYE